jgi:hypothetical protein
VHPSGVGFLREPDFAGDNEFVPEETPEQVMARLARYADTLRRSPNGPVEPAARHAISRAGATTLPARSALQGLARRGPAPGHAIVAPTPNRPTPVPSSATPPAVPMYAPTPRVAPPPNRFVFSNPRLADVRVVILGQVLAAAGCVGAVLAFIFLSTVVASVFVLVALVAGVVAIAGHRSVAWWWTLGVLAGALLGRFS